MSTIKVDTVRPVTADASLTLQGDNSGTGVTGLTIDSSGNATFAGTENNVGTVTAGTLGSSVNIKASINASGSAPIYACRAWVNFKGTGTVAINGSGNVSSITDNGTGDYTVNYTTAMDDANYSVTGTVRYDGTDSPSNAPRCLAPKTYSTGSVRVVGQVGINSALDYATVSVSVFR